MPSQADTEEMARLSRILNGERPAPTAASFTTSSGAPDPNAIIIQTGVSSTDISDMAKIMENFSGATGIKSFKNMYDVGQLDQSASNAVKSLIDDSQNEPQLREALSTSKTDAGMCIGAWEITKHLRENVNSKDDVVYRVHNVNTGQKIKASFLVIESAHCVVKLLNNGADITHTTIKQVANFEIEYRNLRKKALEEKASYQRAKKKGSEFKMGLYEAKFDAAKYRALLIRERIINLNYQC
jgi:hypothetical protein